MGRAWLEDHHLQCGNNEAGRQCTVGEPRPGGITQGTVPVRGGAWTYTKASSQARARLPFCLRPTCHLSNTCPDGTMVLAHTWTLALSWPWLTMKPLAPQPTHWPSPQATPWSPGQVRVRLVLPWPLVWITGQHPMLKASIQVTSDEMHKLDGGDMHG